MKIINQIRLSRFNRLWNLGALTHMIEEYPEELWVEIKKHYYCGTPLYVLLHERLNQGKCYDRSYALTMAFENCKLVRGSLPKYGALKNNKDDPSFKHGWVEDDKYVYDTTFMKRFNKKFYYHLFGTQVNTIVLSEKLNNDEYYKKMKSTTKEDIENSIGIDATNAWLLSAILEEREKTSGRDLSYLKCEVPEINMEEIIKKQDKILDNMIQDREL